MRTSSSSSIGTSHVEMYALPIVTHFTDKNKMPTHRHCHLRCENIILDVAFLSRPTSGWEGEGAL